jgi:hypothetical protein
MNRPLTQVRFIRGVAGNPLPRALRGGRPTHGVKVSPVLTRPRAGDTARPAPMHRRSTGWTRSHEHRHVAGNRVVAPRTGRPDGLLPPEDWSPGFIKAVTALFDLYIGDQLHERPAPVLQLVKPDEGTKPQS